jgi:hypothetical protein
MNNILIIKIKLLLLKHNDNNKKKSYNIMTYLMLVNVTY